jgi:N,N'-diacetylchitobiose phosphorylase
MGRDHSAHGAARHPFMTGSAGWAYYAATKYILGVRPGFDSMTIDPCVPRGWKNFSVTRVWRGAVYNIEVLNPGGVSKGVGEIIANGEQIEKIPVYEKNSVNNIKVYLGATL